MSAGNSSRRWVRVLLYCVTALLILMLGGLLVLMPFSWGRNQDLMPHIAEEKLRLGMTMAEAEFALALRPGTLGATAGEMGDGRTLAKATEAGRLAVYIYPQHEILLTFDSDNVLERAGVHYYWIIEKRYTDLRLDDQLKD